MEPDPLFQLRGFVTNSFGDLGPRVESDGRKKRTQNTVWPNEFTDFEKFTVEHPAGTGITLQLSALRVMYKAKIGKVW